MSGEFWAAILGALVGALAGGGISALLQRWQHRREKRERDRATAQSLFFKVLRIHSDLEGYRQHVAKCDAEAEGKDLCRGWQSLMPIANGPGRIAFTPEEMALLLSLRDMDLFNRILSLDAVHGSTIDMFELYASRRQALLAMMPADMRGSIGTIALTEDDFRRVGPLVVEVQDIDAAIRDRAEKDAQEAEKALRGLNDALRPVLGYRLELEPV